MAWPDKVQSSEEACMTDLPINKTELLEHMESGRREWEESLAQVDPSALDEPAVEGVWSVKQIVAHILGYEEWALAFLTELRDPGSSARSAFDAFWQKQLELYRQDHPDFPALMGETDDDQTNAVVVATYDRYSAGEVLERERQVYGQLHIATQLVPEDRFLEPWKPGGRTLIEILPGQSYTHYQTHLPAIRNWLAARQ